MNKDQWYYSQIEKLIEQQEYEKVSNEDAVMVLICKWVECKNRNAEKEYKIADFESNAGLTFHGTNTIKRKIASQPTLQKIKSYFDTQIKENSIDDFTNYLHKQFCMEKLQELINAKSRTRSTKNKNTMPKPPLNMSSSLGLFANRFAPAAPSSTGFSFMNPNTIVDISPVSSLPATQMANEIKYEVETFNHLYQVIQDADEKSIEKIAEKMKISPEDINQALNSINLNYENILHAVYFLQLLQTNKEQTFLVTQFVSSFEFGIITFDDFYQEIINSKTRKLQDIATSMDTLPDTIIDALQFAPFNLDDQGIHALFNTLEILKSNSETYFVVGRIENASIDVSDEAQNNFSFTKTRS